MTVTRQVDVFAHWVRERLFAPRPAELRRIGLEIEMLALQAGSGAHCPLQAAGDDAPSTLRLVRAYGAAHRWHERRSSKGAPYFELPNGWTLTFEPGGQLELCTAPAHDIGSLLGEARRLVTALRDSAAERGIDLACIGIDPHNDASAVPLQVCSERYVKMTEYFERLGPSGVRMMRQTAATQVSLDGGCDPAARWRLLSDASPYLTSLFANSRRYAREETGFQSFRQRCWRLLDPSRTGVPHPALPPCEAYTRFALEAVDMTRTSPDEPGGYRPFMEWVSSGEWSEAQWESHLTTLFPEVRPRGHLEVRSIDALPPELLGVPVVLLAGLAYDDVTSAEARALLGAADEDMLNRAARCGLHDPQIAETALTLARLALRGARAMGERVVGGEELERAGAFVDEWSARGRSPADARQ
jgi:glutamate--cysteine ligase